jgi:hypothetical protein
MKRPFYDFVVGDKTVSLKLTSKAIIGIEAKINGNFALAIAENSAPSITFMALVIEAGAKEKNPDFTMQDALDLIDAYLDENSFMDLVKVYKDIIDTSGFFKKTASQTEVPEEQTQASQEKSTEQ